MKRTVITKTLFIGATSLLLVACGNGEESEMNMNNEPTEENITSQSSSNQDGTDKQDSTTINENEKEEEPIEDSSEESINTAENIETDSSVSLDNYDEQEIEYARILLMTEAITEDSPVVNVSHSAEGEPIAVYNDGSVNYPEDVTHLTGGASVSGSITYASHGDGNITIYPLPSHWHQEDQTSEGYRVATQEVLDNRESVYVEPATNDEVIEKIESIEFIY